jgi:flagellar motor switch protein FliN/FliY
MNRDKLLGKIPEMVVSVTSDFTGGLIGDHVFLIAPDFAQKLASQITKEDITDLDEMALSVISEVMSQHTGSEITKLSQTNKLPGLTSDPAAAIHVPKARVSFPGGTFAVLSYPVQLDSVSSTLWEVMSYEVATGVCSALGAGLQPETASGGLSAAEMAGLGGMNMNMGSMNAGMNMGGMQMPMQGVNTPNVHALQYPSLQQGMSSMEQGNISLIMDVFMEMTVELGRTKKQIKEILGMGEGTIIELDKLAGEPVDILVNHKPIAKGEVVVIDENFGVRVTEILSPIERVADLR